MSIQLEIYINVMQGYCLWKVNRLLDFQRVREHRKLANYLFKVSTTFETRGNIGKDIWLTEDGIVWSI